MLPANFLQETVVVARQIESKFLELAARLYKIQTEELWRGDYATYGDFLDEAKIRNSIASLLTKIYRCFVVEGRIPQENLEGAPYTNLYDAIPLIASHGVTEAVAMAKTLSRNEIKQNLRDDTHPDCAHETTIVICASCHKRIDAN